MNTKLNYLPVLFLIFPVLLVDAYAEDPILISIASNLDQVIFDGKWTNSNEWKQSSYNQFNFDDGAKIHLRTAHQENFIYVHINFHTDTNVDEGFDRAIICFDTKNDKTLIPQSDDYCFSTTLGTKESFTYQGDDTLTIDDSFVIIPNDKNFIAIGAASDKHDRYHKIPHTSYEFKIPLDVLGRSDNYGFYVSAFDHYSQNYYSWPYDIEKQNTTLFSSPNQWGDLVSPDKSLPEFNFSMLPYLLIPLTITFIIITKFTFLRQIF